MGRAGTGITVMTYTVKEIFYTLQGEGAHTGRPAVFCRFTGCNLWSGREEDRLKAVCQFCDTDFVGTNGVGGGKFKTAEALADRIAPPPSSSAQGSEGSVEKPKCVLPVGQTGQRAGRQATLAKGGLTQSMRTNPGS